MDQLLDTLSRSGPAQPPVIFLKCFMFRKFQRNTLSPNTRVVFALISLTAGPFMSALDAFGIYNDDRSIFFPVYR